MAAIVSLVLLLAGPAWAGSEAEFQGGSVLYDTDAVVTQTGIEADFGRLGRIDLDLLRDEWDRTRALRL